MAEYPKESEGWVHPVIMRMAHYSNDLTESIERLSIAYLESDPEKREDIQKLRVKLNRAVDVWTQEMGRKYAR